MKNTYLHALVGIRQSLDCAVLCSSFGRNLRAGSYCAPPWMNENDSAHPDTSLFRITCWGQKTHRQDTFPHVCWKNYTVGRVVLLVQSDNRSKRASLPKHWNLPVEKMDRSKGHRAAGRNRSTTNDGRRRQPERWDRTGPVPCGIFLHPWRIVVAGRPW